MTMISRQPFALGSASSEAASLSDLVANVCEAPPATALPKLTTAFARALHGAWTAASANERAAAFDDLFRLAQEPHLVAAPQAAALLHDFLRARVPERIAMLNRQAAAVGAAALHHPDAAYLSALRAWQNEAAQARRQPSPPARPPVVYRELAPSSSTTTFGNRPSSAHVPAAPRPAQGSFASLPSYSGLAHKVEAAPPGYFAQRLDALLGLNGASIDADAFAQGLLQLDHLHLAEERMEAFVAVNQLYDDGDLAPAAHFLAREFLRDNAESHYMDIAAEYNDLAADAPLSYLDNLAAMARDLVEFPALPTDLRPHVEELINFLGARHASAQQAGQAQNGPAGLGASKFSSDDFGSGSAGAAAALRGSDVLRTVARGLDATLEPVAKVHRAQAEVRLPGGTYTKTINISALSIQGLAQIYVASTVDAGGFSKFKPAIFADGSVVGVRMVRTKAQKQRGLRQPIDLETGAARSPNVTKKTGAAMYIAERKALADVGSPFAPQRTFVDAKGRIMDVVALADGNIGRLGRVLTPAQQRQMIAVAFVDLVGDLAALQQAGVVHRDIKPGNVMWRRDGSFGLGDYGLAHAAHELADHPYRGTLTWMAPETLLRQLNHPYAIDTYALGLTLVALLRPQEGVRNFPLAIKQPTVGHRTAAYRAQLMDIARTVQDDYNAWLAYRNPVHRMQVPQAPTPAILAIEEAYDDMRAVHPAVADAVFFDMLSSNPAARKDAATLLRQLAPSLHEPVFDKTTLQPALANVVAAHPHNQEVTATLAALRKVAAADKLA